MTTALRPGARFSPADQKRLTGAEAEAAAAAFVADRLGVGPESPARVHWEGRAPGASPEVWRSAEVAGLPMLLGRDGWVMQGGVHTAWEQIADARGAGTMLGVVAPRQALPWALLCWRECVVLYNGFSGQSVTVWKRSATETARLRVLPGLLAAGQPGHRERVLSMLLVLENHGQLTAMPNEYRPTGSGLHNGRHHIPLGTAEAFTSPVLTQEQRFLVATGNPMKVHLIPVGGDFLNGSQDTAVPVLLGKQLVSPRGLQHEAPLSESLVIHDGFVFWISRGTDGREPEGWLLAQLLPDSDSSSYRLTSAWSDQAVSHLPSPLAAGADREACFVVETEGRSRLMLTVGRDRFATNTEVLPAYGSAFWRRDLVAAAIAEGADGRRLQRLFIYQRRESHLHPAVFPPAADRVLHSAPLVSGGRLYAMLGTAGNANLTWESFPWTTSSSTD